MKYWVKRNKSTQEKLATKSVEDIEKQLTKYYQDSAKEILGQFEKTYIKVISTISEGREATPADLYKLDSYWKLQEQVRLELIRLGEKEVVNLTKQFENFYLGVYQSLELPIGDMPNAFSTLDKALINQMINTIWCADGKSWSQRIWDNLELLQDTLNEGLLHCVATGQSASGLKKQLQERFDVSYSRADALVRTEMAHIQTQAAQKRYEDYGIDEVEIWADKDERRCEHCGKLHTKRYPVGAKVPIPAHPRCRCIVIPVVD